MNRKPLLAFLALAYGLSWGLHATVQWAFDRNTVAVGLATGVLFMWGPAIAAFIVRRRLRMDWKELGVVKTGIRWKWVGVAALIAVAWPVITLFFNWLLGDLLGIGGFGHTEVSKAMMLSVLEVQLTDTGWSPDRIQASLAPLETLPLGGPLILLLLLVLGAVAGSTVNLLAALGEELGWRGLLLHLTRRWGLWPHVLFTGIVWGLWHAPLILRGHNYPAHPWAGVFFMCLFTTALALPLAWVRVRSGSIWAAGVLHGTINGVAGSILIFNAGGMELLGGAVGIGAVLALLTIGGGLFLFDPQFRRAFAAP